MKTSFLLLLSLLLSSCWASSIKKETFSLNHGTLVYFSHFNTEDSTFWVGNDGNNYGEVSEGYYYYASLDTVLRCMAPPFPITKEDDFSVEIAIGNEPGQDSVFYGLALLGFTQETYKVFFTLNNSGNYELLINDDLFSGSYEEGVDSDFKKLKIIKKKTETYFLINDVLVYQYVLEDLQQLRAGPATSTSIIMDYIKVEKETASK